MIDELPYYIEHEFYDEKSFVLQKCKCFLSLNRDIYGKWSCGYIAYSSEDHEEWAIPQLVTNSSDSIDEAAIRMKAKVERYYRQCES